ncbi:hypothetical protein PY650_21595 [Rhizobium calliandrae]|uniref:Uncharacterized protein n=1 Tax=Rhizobium calliandrae TaxID=1312182 RepID=A0ABT7KHT1_9HYPH|nr:hypothetical protein [Rhizobium calliandrae]MDL2408194.1 hypothetical protein [Rhizobium calliandrae]
MQSVVDPHMTGIAATALPSTAPAGGKPVSLNGSGRAP